MKRFVFTTKYLGSPEAAVDLLLEPSRFVGRFPYVRKVDVLSRPTIDSLTTSWEVEIDGATLTWREEARVSEDRQSVEFRMLRGDFQSYTGRWLLQLQQDHTILTLEASLDWGAPNFSKFVSRILETKAERALHGMVLMLGRMAQQRSLDNNRVHRRFGFIFHPLDLSLLADGFQDEDLKNKRPAMLAKVMAWIPPFRRGIITGVRSPQGVEIAGDMILMPLLPEQLLAMDEEFVLSRLLDAGHLAERYGDRIVGLGAYAANVGRKGIFLAKQLKIPVTTGSSYTIAVAIEATLKACESVGILLPEANVTIVGATGTIGSICAHLMAKQTRRLTLVARNAQRLEDLALSLAESDTGCAKIIALTDLDAAVSGADVIILATNSPMTIIDTSKIKPGAVICDISRPRNVPEEISLTRPDVLVLDGGVVRPPGKMETGFSFGLAKDLAYACMAETMILALEGRYEAYSLGGNVDVNRVEQISQLAKKHGFTLASMRSYEKEVPEEQMDRVQKARIKSDRKKQGQIESPRQLP